MKRLLALLLALLAASPAFAPAVRGADRQRARRAAVRCLRGEAGRAVLGRPAPDHPAEVAHLLEEPGESGLPTEINWTLPAGVKADPIVWPTPHLFDIGGVINYGFQDEAMLLVTHHAAGRSRRHVAQARGRRPTGWCARTSAFPRTASSSSACRSPRPLLRRRRPRARSSTRRAGACRRKARGRRATAWPSRAIRP